MKKKALTSALISASMLVSSFSGLCAFAADAAPFSYSDGKVTVSKIDGYDSAAIIVAKYTDGGALNEVKITNAASFPATVDAAVGDKVMVWNSADGETGMKPIAETFTVPQPVETENPTENVTTAPETEKPTEVVTTAPETEKPTETVTADPTIEYTVSIGTVTGAEGANIYIVNPAAPTDAPTPTPDVTATPEVTATPPAEKPTGLEPIVGSYTFIADQWTNAGTTPIAADTYMDGAKVYSAEGNNAASNKKTTMINGVEYHNSLRLKGTQNYISFKVQDDSKITTYAHLQDQVGKERAVAAGTTPGGTDLGHGEVGVAEFTFDAPAGTTVYLTGVNASDWTSAGDMYLAGFTVEPKAAVAIAEEGAAAEKYLTTMKAHAGDTITIKANDVPGKTAKVSTAPETVVTDNNGGTYTFTMPAADTVVDAVYETKIPKDIIWRADDAAFASTGNITEDPAIINGLTVYKNWKLADKKAEYTALDGTTYQFTKAWQGGSGSTGAGAQRALSFTPEQACTVTVIFDGNNAASRTMNIEQINGEKFSEDSAASGVTVLSADIEDPTLGDVFIYGGGSNKNIYAVFVEYYDPNQVVYRNLTGKMSYNGTTGIADKTIVFKDTKTGAVIEIPYAEEYSVMLPQRATYEIAVKDASEQMCATLNTNSVYIAKADKEFNIDFVDIVSTEVTGDVVVHEIKNDETKLELSKVEITFTAKDDAQYTYTTGITDNKIAVKMMPNHEYAVTAAGIDGYELSPLSGSYTMVAGDTAPFKNILFTEVLGDVPFSNTVEVGADKAYATINDAMTAIKKMTDRPAGEAGRVTVLIDPGVYTEQVIVDSNYVTLKAADEANRPEIQWYYGIGYLYYSSAGNQYYSEDWAVQKTKKGSVTRWGAACRITGQYCNLESIIIRNTLNCEVTAAELADGVAPALNNEYSDVNGKPDRTVAGYDARTKGATERAAAIALDGGYTELYKCDFISSQDTFYTNKTAYVKECYIEGGTDFIYGGNSMLFEDCTLAWHGYSDQSVGGYLTACKTSGPSTGIPNIDTNGYMFKNTKIVNSKYYPDNQFDAGSWGRNWGGTDCQVVFDGVVLEGVDVPGNWVKMGGELNTSILYVNNVTDKNGSAVDVSGTKFNPNGTMAANGYTMMKDTDYFGGTWVPPHYDNAIEYDKYTSVWNFGIGNGAASYALENTSEQAEILASSTYSEPQKLIVDVSNGGKFNNSGRTDEWCQTNAGAAFTIPVVNGTEISFGAYSATETLTINGTDFTRDGSYIYHGADTTVTATLKSNGYMSYIKTVSPASPEPFNPEPTNNPETGIINKYKADLATFAKGRENKTSDVFRFVDNADMSLAAYFGEDNRTVDTQFVTSYINYIGGTNTADHPIVSGINLNAGEYKVYYLGSSNANVNVTIGGTQYNEESCVELAKSASKTLYVHTMTINLGEALAAGTMEFNSTAGWLPDLYGVVLANTAAPALPEAQTATVSFSLGETAAEGSAPAEITVDKGSEAVIPMNRTAYIAGKTLTGWTDGTSTYAVGESVTVDQDVTLTPVFTDNTVAPTGEVVFNFRRDQGAPTLAIEGRSGILVAQAVVGNVSVDVKLDINTQPGKLNNTGNNDWAQCNTGTKFVVPVYGNATVTVGDIYQDSGVYTINGIEKTGDNQSESCSGETAEIEITGNIGYIRTITVTYPAQ